MCSAPRHAGRWLACIAICIAAGVDIGWSPFDVPLLAAEKVNLTFTPQDQTFAAAAEAYRLLWEDEGPKIVEAMERGSGLKFVEHDIKAVIFEGASSSGFGATPMQLRASYPAEVKKATLVHELGHRLMAQLRNRPADLDEHRMLFLYLYDVWESLGARPSLTSRSRSKAAARDCTTTKPPGNGRARSARKSARRASRRS